VRYKRPFCCARDAPATAQQHGSGACYQQMAILSPMLRDRDANSGALRACAYISPLLPSARPRRYTVQERFDRSTGEHEGRVPASNLRERRRTTVRVRVYTCVGTAAMMHKNIAVATAQRARGHAEAFAGASSTTRQVKMRTHCHRLISTAPPYADVKTQCKEKQVKTMMSSGAFCQCWFSAATLRRYADHVFMAPSTIFSCSSASSYGFARAVFIRPSHRPAMRWYNYLDSLSAPSKACRPAWLAVT